MKIYTRTGDKGETGLIGGGRVSKADLRIVAYGTVDELNSNIGLTISHLKLKEAVFHDLIDILTQIQNDLFLVGSDLADPDYPASKYNTPRTAGSMTSRLEAVIDKFEEELQPITFFILPAGSIEAALLHVCRAVSRRAETTAVALAKSSSINPAIITYLNRMSDLLFVAARLANRRQGVADVAWVKDQP
jgi:cob(I)alamin adenosyltransferase